MQLDLRTKLDRYDRAIVRALQLDGRITNSQLAEGVSLSESACLRRVRTLEDAGFIEGYTALINQQKAGCPVLPVGLSGTRECLPKGARWPRRTLVTITFGKPFLVVQRRADGTRVSHEDASDAIMLAIAELLPAGQRGAFSDLDSLRKRLVGVTQLLPR